MIKKILKKNDFIFSIIRRFKFQHRQPKWKAPVVYSENKDISKKYNPKILIATSVGANIPGTTLESLLAAALEIRGAQVHMLLCDEVLPACMECINKINISPDDIIKTKRLRKRLCLSCYSPAKRALSKLGINIYTYSQFLSEDDLITASTLARNINAEKISDFIYKGLRIGEHALAGTLRFYAKGELSYTTTEIEILRKYCESALLTALAIEKIISKEEYNIAVFHHGIYVPQGIIGEVCRKRNVRVVNWVMAYRRQCFIFSHHDTYHHTLMNESPEAWEDIQFDTEKRNKIVSYLQSRKNGINDWISFQDNNISDNEALIRDLKLDRNKPIIAMLTNVIWDAQLHYPNNIFTSMKEWIIETINFFTRREDLQLIIRIHPAEIRGELPSRQKVKDIILKHFKEIPRNIFIVEPDSLINTYELIKKVKTAIIYGTKTGLELSCTGLPVIVAGEAWVKNKGITFDPASKEEYFDLLKQLPLKKLSEEKTDRALRYAYHFFFRRMIPIKSVKEVRGKNRDRCIRLNLKSPQELIQGHDKGLDLICEGILYYKHFIYDE